MSEIILDKIHMIEIYEKVIFLSPHVAIEIFAIFKYIRLLIKELTYIVEIPPMDKQTANILLLLNSLKNELKNYSSKLSIKDRIINLNKIIENIAEISNTISPFTDQISKKLHWSKVKKISSYIYASILQLTLSTSAFENKENKLLISKTKQLSDIILITNNIKNGPTLNNLEQANESLDILLNCIKITYKQIYKFDLQVTSETKFMSSLSQMGGGKIRKSKLDKLRLKYKLDM